MHTRGLGEFLRELNPTRVVSSLWLHRGLIGQMIRREIGQRYRGAHLGMVWSFLVPLMMMAVYTFVFSVVFKARWRTDVDASPTGEFALTLFAGITAFNVFSEVINRAPSLVLSVPNYVKKVVFPLEILPVVALGGALVNGLISSVLVLMGAAVFMHTLSPTVIFLPLAFLPLMLLSLGLGWFLASLGVYVRDTVQVTGITVQVLFFLSPVFYPVSAVPEKFRPLLLLNPLSTILESFRRCLLWGQMPDWQSLGLCTFGGAVLCMLGYAWFVRTKKGFADVI
jgi:lipopolysaccharide transport system permease protein